MPINIGIVRPLLATLILVAGGAVAMAVYQHEERNATTKVAAKMATTLPVLIAPHAVVMVEPPPPAPLPATLEWPPEQARTQSRIMAYAALLHAWGVAEPGPNPCHQAESMGLRCRTARGGLDELRQIDRPALLTLRDDQGSEFHATLTALDEQSASFSVGGETRVVALDALATQWSGHYTLLWRVPPEARDNLRPGERGPTVDWLARQLAVGQEVTADALSDAVFDDALVRRLRQFQLNQGLIPDGALGLQTVMRLSGVGDQTAPKLLRASEEK